MRVSLKMLLVGLAVVVGLSAGPTWSQEQGIEKELGLDVGEVVEVSEEIKAGEDTGEPTPRGILYRLEVYNYGPMTLDVAYGPQCSTSLGTVPAAPPRTQTVRTFRLPSYDIRQTQYYFCIRRVGKDSTWHRRVYESKFKDTPTTLRWDIRY